MCVTTEGLVAGCRLAAPSDGDPEPVTPASGQRVVWKSSRAEGAVPASRREPCNWSSLTPVGGTRRGDLRARRAARRRLLLNVI